MSLERGAHSKRNTCRIKRTNTDNFHLKTIVIVSDFTFFFKNSIFTQPYPRHIFRPNNVRRRNFQTHPTAVPTDRYWAKNRRVNIVTITITIIIIIIRYCSIQRFSNVVLSYVPFRSVFVTQTQTRVMGGNSVRT